MASVRKLRRLLRSAGIEIERVDDFVISQDLEHGGDAWRNSAHEELEHWRHMRSLSSSLSSSLSRGSSTGDGSWLSFTDMVTRCRSMAVCQTWRARASDRELWTSFELRGGGALAIDDRSLDRLIALAGGCMVSLRLDGLPSITADGLKRLRHNTLLRHVSVTNCIGEWDACQREWTPGVIGRHIVDCLPPSVRVLHLAGCNVHAVGDLPWLTARSWEIDVHECASCARVAHLPSKRRCSRCTVVHCGFRHNAIFHRWEAGCADDVACDTCGSLFCSECLHAMSRCQVDREDEDRPWGTKVRCSAARCATCVAEHGPPTLDVCGACDSSACEACMGSQCAFCNDKLCTICDFNTEMCPGCQSTYCLGCLDAANVSMMRCRACNSILCTECDIMDYSCTRCERPFPTDGVFEGYCRGCTPRCAGCETMLCKDCGDHCVGQGCSTYYCKDCVAPTSAERHANGELYVPVRWAAMERLDLPRSQQCGKCDSMFCPDCWDCPTLMPQCAACTATMCNACAKRAEECADADGNTACPSCGAFICIDCCLEWCKVCHPVTSPR